MFCLGPRAELAHGSAENNASGQAVPVCPQCNFGIVRPGSRDGAEACFRPSLPRSCRPSRCAGGYGSNISCTEELLDFFQEIHGMNRLGEEFKMVAISARVLQHLGGGSLAREQ